MRHIFVNQLRIGGEDLNWGCSGKNNIYARIRLKINSLSVVPLVAAAKAILENSSANIPFNEHLKQNMPKSRVMFMLLLSGRLID
jgi:hypothetical protein